MKNEYHSSLEIKPLFHMAGGSDLLASKIAHFATDGYNKAIGEALIDAKNDTEAISTFLNEFRESSLTYQSYAKEIERLRLWCIYVAKVNISSLRCNHLVEYQSFLKNPQPRKIWCGPKASRQLKDEAINPAWRPFGPGGLSTTTLNKTISILDSFFNYLVQTNYLTGNPLAIERRRKKRNHIKLQIIDRYLELDEIHATLDALSEDPIKDEENQFQVIRARYIILLLFYTGLRIAEAAQHRMGNFTQREGNWFLRVIGKGKKLLEIPIPDELLTALAEFRLKVGLSSLQPQFTF